MIFKYDTKKINGKHYIVSSRLKSEHGEPDYILEFDQAFTKSMTNEDGKLQYRVELNPAYDISKPVGKDNQIYTFILDPVPLSLVEKKAKRDREVKRLIHENYQLDKEIKLLNLAIEALANNKPLPKEYIEYRKKIEEIKKWHTIV